MGPMMLVFFPPKFYLAPSSSCLLRQHKKGWMQAFIILPWCSGFWHCHYSSATVSEKHLQRNGAILPKNNLRTSLLFSC